MQPRIYSVKDRSRPASAVYVGHPSKWGNPFIIGKDGDRAAVIVKYEHMILARPDLLLDAMRELCGKDLVCHCAPLACHASVLWRIANDI
jgi:hypothetical protein